MYVYGRTCLLTEHVEGEGETCEAEALEETQRAERGDVGGEGHTQTEHQHKHSRQHHDRVPAKPEQGQRKRSG